eukprot:NODE_13941_length_237_cov_132.214286.p4 GENE.NODE_13941_length_237_cov_132.214286~~NODE_13941_length_237_cov_132.214286.p4  ORF type:complete len:57 (-),score=23.22 NODE_13941_length_237_cov_132.214286:49-219(-)
MGWHLRSRWTCKVCGHVAQNSRELDVHKKLRQHQDSAEQQRLEAEAEADTKPFIVG